MNYLANAIGTTHDGRLPRVVDACKASSPRLNARELPPSQFEKKQFSFFGFFSLFSLFSSEKNPPASQLSASVPTYEPSPGEASILLPHYLRTRDYEGLDRYLKDQPTPCMDLPKTNASLNKYNPPVLIEATKNAHEVAPTLVVEALTQKLSAKQQVTLFTFCLIGHDENTRTKITPGLRPFANSLKTMDKDEKETILEAATRLIRGEEQKEQYEWLIDTLTNE